MTVDMKILALDIGAGTEDVLLFDDSKANVENCIKMVLPSPSLIYADKVKEATRLGEDLYIRGDSIGGGSLTSALINHVKRGLRVLMAKDAAYTLRNNLDQVKDLGIEISEEDIEENFDGNILTLEEINLGKLQEFLVAFEETLLDLDMVAIAVQDHGVFPKGISNRKSRLQKMREILTKNPKPEALAFIDNEIPSCFLRMQSAARASKRQLPKPKTLLMDTATDAILGCLNDIDTKRSRQLLVVNVGNGHTIAALISDGNITGILEHHTRMLSPTKIERFLIDFTNGTISDNEVFKDGGHGLFYLAKAPGFTEIDRILATGPNRRLLAESNLEISFANPAGDVMMTGPIGLVEASIRKLRCD
jgi:uncharacterized protein (DUF1786 family)